MSRIYADRKRADSAAPTAGPASVQPSFDALRTGAARPTREQTGRRVDLPDAMREKMESAFGADLSSLKLYESETVAEAGAKAVTRGADIAFAPGLLDFTSFGGQALLGHEISHVVSQARGEVTGGGFLNDHALEARADTEGAMAAAGQQVAMPSAAMSGVTAAAAAGPMQAKDKDKDKDKKRWNPFRRKEKTAQTTQTMPAYEGVHIAPALAGEVNTDRDLNEFHIENNRARIPREGGPELAKRLVERYKGSEYRSGEYLDVPIRDVDSEQSKGRRISGFYPGRVIGALKNSLGAGKSDEELTQIMDNVMAPKLKNVGGTGEGAISTEQAHGKYVEGLKGLKQLNYERLLQMEATYGRLGSQMHPEDFMRQVGPEYYEHTSNIQDAAQLMADSPEGVFDYENSADDRRFRDLADYYGRVINTNVLYASGRGSIDPETMQNMIAQHAIPTELEERIGGPSMGKKQAAAYQKGLKKRAQKGGWQGYLFGRFQ